MKHTRTEAARLVTQQIGGDLGAEAQLLLSLAFYALDKRGRLSERLLDQPKPPDFGVQKDC